MARNLLIDDVRRRSHDALIRAVRGTAADEDDALARLVAEVAPPDHRARQAELGRLIDELLTEIPEDQRITFVLHHYSDLPLAEVAEVMETSVATTKSRLRLAREKLAEKLSLRGEGVAGMAG
jgi:RNA polymerase sigma-70 factor (ECF subfamily)